MSGCWIWTGATSTTVNKLTASIKRGGIVYRAAVCPQCETKVWPMNVLAAHIQSHERRNEAVKRNVDNVKSIFIRMRPG